MDVTRVITLIVLINKATSFEEKLCLQTTMRCFGILHQCLLVLSAVTWGVWFVEKQGFFFSPWSCSCCRFVVMRAYFHANRTYYITMIMNHFQTGMILQVPPQCHVSPGNKALWRDYQPALIRPAISCKKRGIGGGVPTLRFPWCWVGGGRSVMKQILKIAVMGQDQDFHVSNSY